MTSFGFKTNKLMRGSKMLFISTVLSFRNRENQLRKMVLDSMKTTSGSKKNKLVHEN